MRQFCLLHWEEIITKISYGSSQELWNILCVLRIKGVPLLENILTFQVYGLDLFNCGGSDHGRLSRGVPGHGFLICGGPADGSLQVRRPGPRRS